LDYIAVFDLNPASGKVLQAQLRKSYSIQPILPQKVGVVQGKQKPWRSILVWGEFWLNGCGPTKIGRLEVWKIGI
jgi:hypothetical protein